MIPNDQNILLEHLQNMDWNTGKWWVQEGKHRNAMLEHGIEQENDKDRNWNWTKLEMVILRTVLVIPELSMELNSGIFRSQC